MMLFKDYSTGKKSLTITGLVISFLVCVVSFIFILLKLIEGQNTYEDVAFGFLTLAFLGIFVALYYQKRMSFSKDGLSIEDQEIGFQHESDSK